MKPNWRTLKERLWHWAFVGVPPCPLCGEWGETEWKAICATCMAKVEWIKPLICTLCGREMGTLEDTGHLSGRLPVEPTVPPCGDCQRRPLTYFRRNRSAVEYNDAVKDWMHLYKYKGKRSMLEPLSELMLQAYWLHYSETSYDRITYVPLHPTRQYERGFNQAEELARQIGQKAKAPVVGLLERSRYTDKQSQSGRAARLEGVAGAFEYVGESIEGLHILVIDDVYTTGTTVNEVARTLQLHGAESIDVLTLAR
jgi:competence protein ComFC